MEYNKKWTEVTLNLWSNIIGDSIVDNNSPNKLLLTNTQNLKLCKAFANNSSANIKLSKTQLHKIGQSGGFLGRLSGPLLKTGLHLIGNYQKEPKFNGVYSRNNLSKIKDG